MCLKVWVPEVLTKISDYFIGNILEFLCPQLNCNQPEETFFFNVSVFLRCMAVVKKKKKDTVHVTKLRLCFLFF